MQRETFCTVSDVKNIVKKFRLSRGAERFVKEREKKGHTLGMRQQGCRSPNALSYEQLGSRADFIEANTEFARKQASDLLKNMFMESKGLMFKRLKNSSDLQTGQLTLGQIANRKLENIVDSGASLHLKSMNELTSGEQDTIRRSKEPPS